MIENRIQQFEYLDKAHDNFFTRAEFDLQNLGIELMPSTFRDVYRITSRDTQGSSYPYNAGFSSLRRTRFDRILVKDGVEIGYYLSGIQEDLSDNKKEGEIGMVHISPALRGKGLASLSVLTAYMNLLEQGAEKFKTVIGDETGAIESLIKKLDFVYKGNDRFDQSVWTREIDDKEKMLETLWRMFKDRTNRTNESTLEINPEEVDIDNPERVSVEEVINDRIQKTGTIFEGSERVLFGYSGAPIILYQLNLTDNSTVAVLRLQGETRADKDVLASIAKRELDSSNALVDVYQIDPPTWELRTPPGTGGLQLAEYLKVFARIGDSFYHKKT